VNVVYYYRVLDVIEENVAVLLGRKLARVKGYGVKTPMTSI
jgi:hypothetical protein